MSDEQLMLELRDALNHLDDLPYLQAHPLASKLSVVASSPEPSKGQVLRRTLRWAIAALDPGSSPNQRMMARSYSVLYHYAVSGQSMEAIATSLGLSRRQAYRELHHGLEGLAAILTDPATQTAEGPSAAGAGEPPGAQVQEELERLSWVGQSDLSLCRLVMDVVRIVQPLASERGVQIECNVEARDTRIIASRVLLRQALLNLLSHAASVHLGARLSLRIVEAPPNAILGLHYRPRPDENPVDPQSPYAVAMQSLELLGAKWVRDETGDGFVHLHISLPLRRERKVLIVDDNEGFIALFRRYLVHEPFVVQGASDLTSALEAVDAFRPEVIVLDVVMPDLDGWEVLQRLRATEAGRAAHVIICSVINDPTLARALGAQGFLAKPVDRPALLQALDAVSSPIR